MSRNARHRKPPPIPAAFRGKPAQVAAAVAGSVLAVSGWPAAAHWAGTASPSISATALSAPGAGSRSQVNVTAAGRDIPMTSQRAAELPQLGLTGRGGPGPSRSPVGHRAASGHAARPVQSQRHAPVYRDPFRDVSGLIPERIDMGVDFGGSGPVYALGDGVITNATGDSAGWPGGGWITYRLTSGPDAGLMVFLAEDVTPSVHVGQHVSSSTVIATMFNGGDGIETGWAQPDGSSAESQLPEAGGISGYGPFPTRIGLNFEEMLQSLGVPAGNNRSDPPSGILPPNYPATWK